LSLAAEKNAVARMSRAPVGLRLSARERMLYAEQGFFLRPDVFSEMEVVQLCAAAEHVVGRAREAARSGGRFYQIDGNRYLEIQGMTLQYEHGERTQELRVIQPFHHLDAHFDALVRDPRLVEPMRDLVASECVALFTDKLNLKRPREGSGFRWHQDSPYWAFACDHVERLPNAMLTLDTATRDNGCLRLIPGSHRRGILPGTAGSGALDPLFTDPRCFDADAQVLAEMSAGSLLFFHPHLVHGSEANLSHRGRRAVVLTYQPGGHPMFRSCEVKDVG